MVDTSNEALDALVAETRRYSNEALSPTNRQFYKNIYETIEALRRERDEARDRQKYNAHLLYMRGQIEKEVRAALDVVGEENARTVTRERLDEIALSSDWSMEELYELAPHLGLTIKDGENE